MGKNFSCNNTGKRNKNDFYQTPYSMTEQLLEHEEFDYNKEVFEPASGEGAIVKILIANWNNTIFSMDKIVDGADFLAKSNCLKVSYIITNPPFSLAFEFVQKAKQIAKKKFAFLLPLSYLHGQKRYEQIYTKNDNYRLKKVWVFTRYPLLTDTVREDGKYNTGMQVYAWFIWVNGYSGLPVVDWIDNNKYILSKKDKN